jgi:hypothetical protein
MGDDLGKRSPPSTEHRSATHHCFNQSKPERLVPQRRHPQALGSGEKLGLAVAVDGPGEPK